MPADSYPKPTKRRLRVFAFDPAASVQLQTAVINDAVIELPWEKPWEDPVGLGPAEDNPQFHQQMVFAVAMKTIRLFEQALGRHVFWSIPDDDPRVTAIRPSSSG